MAEAPAVTATSPWKPPCHEPTIRYTAVQVRPPPLVVVVVGGREVVVGGRLVVVTGGVVVVGGRVVVGGGVVVVGGCVVPVMASSSAVNVPWAGFTSASPPPPSQLRLVVNIRYVPELHAMAISASPASTRLPPRFAPP